MNEELQQALADMINQSVVVAGDALAFTQEQLPEVVQQLLVWKMVASLISFLGFGCVLYFIYRINRVQFHYFKDKNIVDHPELAFNVFQMFWILPLVALWSIKWLQIWLAPKVYLIEYAANLVK